MKRPRSRALLPQSVARLVGFTALAVVGALEWQRLIGGMSVWRALLWVAVAVAAAVAVLAAERVSRARFGVLALPAVVAAGLLAGYLLSGAGLDLLRPRHWDELITGLADGLLALGTVRLPYVSADPWPAIVLELLGAELLILAGLLTFWPRIAAAPEVRAPFAPPERGYPFVALAVLLVVVASPVVSLGGTRSLVLGLVLAALTVVFLWLERLPLKPGLGIAALVAIALAGALPLAAVADRGQPWFDYRAFAESLGPDDPVRFSWTQSYGAIDWPREGNEVMRITSAAPQYWKARNLDIFDKYAWTTRDDPTNGRSRGPESDLPEDWATRPAWSQTIAVSVRRMRSPDVIGAGTIVDVDAASRNVRPGLSAGTWDAPTGLRRGDSYTAEVHVPKPPSAALAEATSGDRERQDGQRVITVPFQPGQFGPAIEGGMSDTVPLTEAEVHFEAWDGDTGTYAIYPTVRRSEGDVDAVMERSEYARTWELSKQLKAGKTYAMDYVRAVYDYLHRPEFRYSERPPQAPFGRPALDFFLNQSHQGYCQHYAGAMALLLRMGGISARVATGFSPGGYSARRKAWVVRDTDAHAWVEVWFDRYGWVAIDPTPAATPARSQIAVLQPLQSSPPVSPDRDTGAADAASGDAPPISLRPELRLGVDDEGGTSAGVAGSLRRWLWALAALVAIALALAVVLYVRRPRGATPMDRAIAEVEDALRRVGRPVSTGTTMTQLEDRLGSHSPEAAAYLRALAAGRYAPRPEPPPPSGRRALRGVLAQGLGFGARARALWALPPRIERRPRERTFEVETTARG